MPDTLNSDRPFGHLTDRELHRNIAHAFIAVEDMVDSLRRWDDSWTEQQDRIDALEAVETHLDELRLGYSIMVGERRNCYHVAGDMRMALNIVGSETEKSGPGTFSTLINQLYRLESALRDTLIRRTILS